MPKPRFGLNCGAHLPSVMWHDIRNTVGPFTGWRAYQNPGLPTVWPGMSSGAAPAEAVFKVMSYKPDPIAVVSGALDADIRSLVAGAEPGAMITFWHEGESTLNALEMKAMHAHAYTIVKQARPDVLYGQIVMAYTASTHSSEYPLDQWIAKRSDHRRLDFYGIDGYRQWDWQTVTATFDAAKRAIRNVAPQGRIAVTEVNAAPEYRHQFLQDVYAWAVTNNCLTYFPFYFPTDVAGDGPYQWDPADAPTLKAIYQATLT